MTRKHSPLGPNDSWKTGQRVPSTGNYRNQYGQVVRFDIGTTFPPCVGRDYGGAVAFWVLQVR